MRMSLCVLTFLLCAAPISWAVQADSILPAGTLLSCTLDEPNFSSRTAERGDPVLCHISQIEIFGRPLLTRGAYLSAQMKDFRDPGHFVGKGWLQLEFTNLTLPGGNFPLDAKIIAAGRYRVDAQGKIRGKGHPVRDAVEWTIPLLWPVKVLTLPARGPRPTLKGETRLTLRLMTDIAIPASATTNSGGLTSRSSYEIAPSEAQPRPDSLQRRPTLIVLRGGSAYLVADYWVDRGNLDYTTRTGTLQILPLDTLDVPMTQRLNAERGVVFTLTTRTRQAERY
jgi:hypothetical protein